MQQNIAAYSINLQKENKKRRKKIIIEKLIEGLKKKCKDHEHQEYNLSSTSFLLIVMCRYNMC